MKILPFKGGLDFFGPKMALAKVIHGDFYVKILQKDVGGIISKRSLKKQSYPFTVLILSKKSF
jgi:hypothetical protein